MNETIFVNFKMNINNNGQTHLVQFYDEGKRFIKNEKTYIKLKEPIINEDKYNNLMLICDNNELVIIRNGSVNMRQSYKENEFRIGQYNNEYISSEITTFTKKYNFTKDNIYLNYDIVMDNDIIGSYQMEISIKGEGKDEQSN